MVSNILDYLRRFIPKEVSGEDMFAIEENAVSLGLPRLLLMENAGACVADFIIRNYGVNFRNVLFVCGTGNNGGDGFVAARHLRNSFFNVKVILLGKPSEIKSEEAKVNWLLIEKMDDVEKFFLTDTSLTNILNSLLEECDIIVDAILGTGVKGTLRDPIKSVVEAINLSGKPVIAVDIPTGLNPSTGEVQGEAIKASHTITFHKMKVGLVGRKDYTGEVVVKDIGIPFEAEFFTGPGDLRRVIKPRKSYSHKGDYGTVLVVGGCEFYSGAPTLAALSSYRTGAGLVYIVAPSSIALSIRPISPDLIVYPTNSQHLKLDDVELIKGLLPKADVVVIGPGLGLHPETIELVHEVLRTCKGVSKVVLDADGFKAVKDAPHLLNGTVATPHAGEFKHVFNILVGERWWERIDSAIEVAKKYNFTLLLKGHDTLITDGYRVKVNRWSTSGLAVGGSGDVLSGILGTFISWGNDYFSSAAAAAYVHGEAGIKAVSKKGFHILASDLLDMLPDVLKPFDREVEGS
ncbi:MAG: NAD(P)H-hydrate dehydratase [Nitrososphaeria archaeon]